MKRGPETTTVARVMSSRVEYCFDDEMVNAVARKMQEKKIRRLPVMEHNKQIVGKFI